MLKYVLKSFLRFISWLPLSMVTGLGSFFGFILGHVIRHRRKEALNALKRSIPELSDRERKRIINAMYRLQGINGLEMVWYSMHGLDAVRKAVDLDGLENFERALARGKGVLALTAHIGNFEMMPMATAATGYKLSVIVKRIKNESVNEVLNELRAHEGLTFLSTKNAFRNCLKALKRNEVVGMIVDQNMTREEGIFVDFFGKRACTSPGLAYLAVQSGAPIVPVFIYRNPNGRHTFKILPLIEPPPDREPETIHRATQHYTNVVEEAIRKAPEQWIWIHRRWYTAPLSEKRKT